MKPTTENLQRPTSAADRAAAAAWIARLHGEHRTPEVEAGLRRWLAASAAHRRAFDLANTLWTEAERWPKRETPAFVGWRRARSAFSAPRMLAAATFVGIAITAAFVFWRSPVVVTRVGEQRNLTLEDGTQVMLNTSTRIRVLYDRTARRVELERGEALFKVARRSDRPFLVVAGGKQVMALGTSFLVSRLDERLAVTLLDGKVSVSSGDTSSKGFHEVKDTRITLPLDRAKAAQRQSGEPTSIIAGSSLFTLSPGQRLSFMSSRSPKLDQPALNKVTAWQRGEVVLDRTPLADAVAEMNRYSAIQLVVGDPLAYEAGVTGIFQAGDSENFALAVAETYGLKVVSQGEKIWLTGVPKKRRSPIS